MDTIRIAVHGAAGRMGRRLVALASADDELEVAAALEAAGHPELGKDCGQLAGVRNLGVPLADQLSRDVDAVVDFSTPDGVAFITAVCLSRTIPLVIATTGLGDSIMEQVAQASQRIPLVHAPNMSLAVNLTMKLVQQAAQALRSHPSGADVEIIERHHRYKEDAPSGTALRFGQIVAATMGQTSHKHGRSGRTGQRPRTEIGYHAVRIGDNPGEHTIVFGLLGESIELTVRAVNRDCYALGALAAAKFVARQSPGLYDMNDVLGL